MAEQKHSEFVRKYNENGYYFPTRIFSTHEAQAYRNQLETLEKQMAGVKAGNKDQLNYPHVLFRFVHDIVCNSQLLDHIEAILGPDILVWGSTFFIKEPHTKNYVSWHQDLRYWGLSDEDGEVSAWLALSDVTIKHGAMKFLPKSHKGPIFGHKDTYADDNILTRGQEADVLINDRDVVHAELEAGEVSFHHGKLLHASAPNEADDRRIGLGVQYISAHVKQNVAEHDYAMLVRGEDRYGHFLGANPPDADLSPGALECHKRILDAQNQAMYQ